MYVPQGTKELYATTDGWREFQNVVEMESSGICPVHANRHTGKAYNLNGVELPTATAKGVVIQNGKKYIGK